jgi:hypothetical protein
MVAYDANLEHSHGSSESRCRALVDYTRTLLREPGDSTSIRAARQAASGRLEERCFAFAAELARAAGGQSAIEDDVVRPMRAIVEDWAVNQDRAPTSTQSDPTRRGSSSPRTPLRATQIVEKIVSVHDHLPGSPLPLFTVPALH